MSRESATPSITDLIRTLADDVIGLFRKELRLAKAEASEKVSQTISALELLLASAVLMIGALGVLLSALVAALAAVFIAQGMGEASASSLSAGIVGVLLAVVAWLLLSRAMSNLKASNIALPKTVRSLDRDVNLVKEKL
ncbi:phage holin family protein [Bauldia litoralis]|uniref:Putative Holin-X, holin superfamily III n=1 Tax=Bauldia litoralis TaxID=665467 RepID=A0A1G6EMX6_9HYPH|nr:phage holin family protein [Bauldia litoralis]SDB58744.1 Putative Holin-X, holin superfamily III [Bauldia litoralis]